MALDARQEAGALLYEARKGKRLGVKEAADQAGVGPRTWTRVDWLDCNPGADDCPWPSCRLDAVLVFVLDLGSIHLPVGTLEESLTC